MKRKIGNQNVLYPMPVTIVGAMVDGKPNFINIAHVGIFNAAAPHLISLGMSKLHYTNKGIRLEKAFSVNILSEAQVVEADYVGIVTGKKTDKSGVFEVFFGELGNAPLISNCPLSMECRLHDTVDTRTHDVFVGEIVATYADDSALTDGRVDLTKVRPLLFDMTTRKYWSLGNILADCWKIGKMYKQL